MNTAAFTRLLAAPTGTDADLLRRFADARDEAAFAELVRRHGGLVRGTARRLLGDAHAADDVTQAAFLLLARKAGSDGWGRTVGPWLYQVACRLARKARGRRSRHCGPLAPRAVFGSRSRSERTTMADPSMPVLWAEVRVALDAELGRLPATLRDPLILCYLEGQTRDEAAAAVGCTPAVLKGRLERGRAKLRDRLERRGLTLSVGLAAVVADPDLPAVSAGAVAKLAAGGSVPPGVAALLGGTLAVWKLASAAAVVLGAVAAGAVAMTAAAPQPGPKAEAPMPAANAEPAVASARVDALGDPLPDGAVARLGTGRFRPGGNIEALIVSPDGRRVASWSEFHERLGQLMVWDAATGKELASARTLERTLEALAWSRDGRGFAVLRTEEKHWRNTGVTLDLRVWEFSADPPVAPPNPDGGRFYTGIPAEPIPTTFRAAAASPDGKRLAVGTAVGDGPAKVRIYPLKPIASLKNETPVAEFDAPPVRCGTLAFTPDGKFLVGAANGGEKKPGTLVVWDAAVGTIARTVPVPDGYSRWGVRLAVADAWVAVSQSTGDAYAVDLRTGVGHVVPVARRGSAVRAEEPGVDGLAFSPDGTKLAACGYGGGVRVCDVATGAVVRDYKPSVEAIAFSPDGSRLYGGGNDGIWVWDTATGKLVGSNETTSWMWGVGLSADGRTALTDTHGQTLRVWDARTGVERRAIPTGARVAASALSPDGRRVVAVGGFNLPEERMKFPLSDGRRLTVVVPGLLGGPTLRAWDADTGADVTPPGWDKKVQANGLRFTPDGTGLVAHGGKTMIAWDWPSGRYRWEVEVSAPATRIDTVDITADGKWIVTVAYASRGSVVDLWDATTREHVHRLADSDRQLLPALFLPDGNLLLTANNLTEAMVGVGDEAAPVKFEALVVEPQTGRVLRQFKPVPRPPDSVFLSRAFALSADGKVLFRPVAGGGFHAYEVATGRFRFRRDGHRDDFYSVAVAADDVRRLLTGSRDSTALVWDVGFTPGGQTLPAGRMAELWDFLVDEDAEKGYRTMRELAADPAGFAALAAEKLKPTPASPSASELAPVFLDLGDPAFAVRQAASAKLLAFGEAVVPAVRDRLRAEPSAEARERLTAVLDRYGDSPTGGDGLRRVRAVELLEHLDTADARRVLDVIAAGGPSRQTADSATAAKRLSRRP